MRTIKMLLNAVLLGMAGGAGGLIVMKIVDVAGNPVNQAKVKRVFKNIKDEFAQ